MARYLLRRLIASIPILIGVSILIFLAIRLVPGDAITATLGTEAGMLSPEQRASLRSYYGLDRPIVEQYVYWVGQALHGNLGLSIRQGKPVLDLIIDRFPLTLELAILAIGIALAVGIPLGLISAIRHNTIIDLIARLFALVGLSMPSFLVGTLIIFVLSVG